jgi:hypothetical protein
VGIRLAKRRIFLEKRDQSAPSCQTNFSTSRKLREFPIFGVCGELTLATHTKNRASFVRPQLHCGRDAVQLHPKHRLLSANLR